MANYKRIARKKARQYGLDPNIFGRQIKQESGYNPNAVSPAGAIGIAQIMPATAKGWGVNPHDPVASLDAAARNMASYVKKYGSYRDALVAYNAGPGRVGGPLPAETQHYIANILGGSNPKGVAKPKRVTAATATNAASPSADAKTQIALSLLGMGNLGGSYGGPDPLTTALIEAAQQQKATKTAPAAASYGPAPAGTSGRLLGHPQDRPGAHTSKAIVSFVSQVAGVYGKPVRLGTGTAHNRLTVNGNVSAHWSGNALDLPASGKQNLSLGRAALVAAGMPAAQARMAKGGIYNIGGKQIIFQTNEGGNHFNHVHVGLHTGR